jgi:hypothetical protein
VLASGYAGVPPVPPRTQQPGAAAGGLGLPPRPPRCQRQRKVRHCKSYQCCVGAYPYSIKAEMQKRISSFSAAMLIALRVAPLAAATTTPGEASDAAFNYCMAQYSGTVVGNMRAQSCFADLMAKLMPQYNPGTEAILSHYAREMNYIVDKYTALVQDSPVEQWNLIMDLFEAESRRAMSEMGDDLARLGPGLNVPNPGKTR